MRFLYFGFVSLIVVFNIGLALAFHDQPQLIDPTRQPLAQPEFLRDGGSFFKRSETYRSGNMDGDSFAISNPLGGIDTIQELVDRLIDALIVLATPIAVIMVLWGGYKVMTSAGDSKKYTEGGKVILYAAVGFGILLLAKGVAAIIESLVYGIV